jgi:hypothetical protein
VQIREVGLGAGGAVERLHVGAQLDEIAGHEARREAHVAQHLHEQPARVAARSRRFLQRLLRRLDAGLHADAIGDHGVELAVEIAQVVDGDGLVAAERGEEFPEERAGRLRLEVGSELLLEVGLVGERPVLRLVGDEEVERVDDGHVGHEIDRHDEAVGLLGQHHAGAIIGEGILLPIDEVGRRLEL